MKRTLALVIALSFVAVGCSAASAGGPPEINYGRDLCIECGMVIDDDRFAAAYRLPDGTEKQFDDLGGLIIHGRETGDLASATVWVHDFETREWIDASAAFYVPTRGVTSPMGHGILAFALEERAMQTAHDLGGDVLRWAVVVDLPVIDGLVGHHHTDEMDESHEHDMTEDDQ